jgi:hypothetical protein
VRLVIPGARDTVQFEVPVVAQRCGPGTGLLLQGQHEGFGLMVWLRHAGVPDTGTYPLVSRGDTMPGAVAAVRFLHGKMATGMTIDDGSATVTHAGPPYALHVRGLGVETAIAQQRRADLILAEVPLLPDSVPCRVEP